MKYIAITTQEQADELMSAIKRCNYDLHYIDGYDVMDNDVENQFSESDTFYYHNNDGDVTVIQCEDEKLINYLLDCSCE